MFATASRMRAWVLIEVRGAWGANAVHESALGAQVPPRWKDDLKSLGIRPVCIRADHRPRVGGVRLLACLTRRPGAPPAVLWRRDVDSLVDVVSAVDT